jgi:uncharacterized RDD family membrane protein YckC/RNA polymerase subunit RPABC4/transcription elongation factor Spt4
MYCRKCGFEVSEEADFCPNCGSPIQPPAASVPPATRPRRRRPPRPQYAGWWMRWLGYSIIDGLVVAGIALVLSLVLWMMFYASNESPTAEEENTFTAFVALFAYAAGFVYFWVSNSIGRSVGKLILGLRVVMKDTGEAPGAARGFLRTFGYAVSTVPLLLGFLWAAWDKDRQAWHDKMAGTVVVSTAQKRALPVEKAEALARAEGRPPPAEPLPAEQSKREARPARTRHRLETGAQRIKRRRSKASTQAGAGVPEERLHEDAAQEPPAQIPQGSAATPAAATQPREPVCPNCGYHDGGDRTSCPHCGMPLTRP